MYKVKKKFPCPNLVNLRKKSRGNRKANRGIEEGIKF